MDSVAKPSATLQQAKARLESAIGRLEQALEARSGGSAANGVPDVELIEARAEISQLRQKNEAVAHRLDAAIGRMKLLLEEEA